MEAELRPTYDADPDIYDRYEREADEYLASHGLRVAAEMLPAVRAAIVRETRHEADFSAGRGSVPGNTSLMRICVAQLWHGGAVEDALLVCRARRTSMDATGAIDGELMLGAGVLPTRWYLVALGTDEASEALRYVSSLAEGYEAGRFAADLDDYYRNS
ncbi:hypothetical protein ACQEVZ_06020 [Dactylosporangium sp. CA-152071]|uniref:hypothetical protein n=1 Tax=Dactylosporangium sp. CA-152071 TaxID=3239933 RepID=UPI003D8DB0F3